MGDAWTGEMTPREALHPFPCPSVASSLATAANHAKPLTSDLVHETADAVTVARDGMIIQPALHNASQPSSRVAKGVVHSLSQFRLDRLERGTHAFGYRVSMDREPAVLSSLGTLVREAKKVESFRSAFAAPFTAFARIATELDQTRFPIIQLQAELGEPRAEFFQTRRRLVTMLKAEYDVIRIAYDNHIAVAAVCPPPRDPQVKHIVQEHVREER